MIGIYARQSVDREDSISIETQIDYCKYETHGEQYKIYSDKGYSGKNTERPQFQEMMSDIEKGLISKVIVYKLDRISRSILDFSNMMERFQKYKVEFSSTNEKFDTSTPIGRAMLNICIVFAQLERETIQKRVTDAYFSRSQKSFYMGGRVPYGYRLEPTIIENIKTSMYVVESVEAEQIKLIYELYSRPECSYGDIIRYFIEQKISYKNNKPWDRSRIADILKNPVYVMANLSVYEFYKTQGVNIINPPEDFIGINACYYYKAQGKSVGTRFTDMEGNILVIAPHQGIIPSDLWLKCRIKCLNLKPVTPYQKAKNTWLAGKIKCGVCGHALIDRSFKKSPTRYLLCNFKMNNRGCAGAGKMFTEDIETIVFQEIKKKLAEFETLKRQNKDILNPELNAIQIELANIEQEIGSLVDKLINANDSLYRYINQRVAELDTKKQELNRRALELKMTDNVDYKEINNHITDWENLSFEDKRQVLDKLVKVIHATSEKVSIEWRI